MWRIHMRRRQVLLGTASLVALAFTSRGRLARARSMDADDGLVGENDGAVIVKRDYRST